MAGLQQLNSFITKFVNLWQSGFDASLEVKAHAGEARISLQVGLGQAPPSSQNKPPKQPGPSRLRRREKREEARKSAEKTSRSDLAVEAEQIEVDEAAVIENMTEDTADNSTFLSDQPLAEKDAAESRKGDSAVEAETILTIQNPAVDKMAEVSSVVNSEIVDEKAKDIDEESKLTDEKLEDELCPDTIYYAAEIPKPDDIKKLSSTSQKASPEVKQPIAVQKLSASDLKMNPSSFHSLFPPGSGSNPTPAVTQESRGISSEGFPPIASRNCTQGFMLDTSSGGGEVKV
jgi:hypothetical protein